MIARLSGILLTIDPTSAVVSIGDGSIAYEVMMPAITLETLAGASGSRVELRTFEYLESQNQGASFTPRMVGFVSADDQRLFELLTKVKGLGVKRALRAMAAPTAEIAAAIAAGDANRLKGLPEIGKKLADTIVLELKDKAGALALGAALGSIEAKGSTASPTDLPAAQNAISALVRLGEDRDSAEAKVREVVRAAAMTPDEMLAASFEVRV